MSIVLLNEDERSVIWALEREGFHLRNITFTSYPKGESDFDLIMSVEDQTHWMENGDNPDFEGTRLNDGTLRRKYQKKYETLLTLPFAVESIGALRQYLQAGVPMPKESEVAFWCCSCLPSYNGAENVLYTLTVRRLPIFCPSTV